MKASQSEEELHQVKKKAAWSDESFIKLYRMKKKASSSDKES